MSSIRYNSHRDSTLSSASGSKRTAPPSSNVTSVTSSDNEDDDNGELPASGLVAPWEVLRNLANVAIQREAKVFGLLFSNKTIFYIFTTHRRMETAASRRAEQEHRRPIDSHDRLNAERFDTRFAGVCIKMASFRPVDSIVTMCLHEIAVVTKEIISEKEARELFRM
jgi:hypothetical protein